SISMRSRAVCLPSLCCLSTALGPPQASTLALSASSWAIFSDVVMGSLPFAQFQQYAVGGLGMEEGDAGAAGAIAGSLINQADPFLLQFRQGGVNVVHPDGDVLDALAVLLDEAGNGAVGRGTLQQLQ